MESRKAPCRDGEEGFLGKGTKKIGAMEGGMEKTGVDVTWEAERKGDNIGK